MVTVRRDSRSRWDCMSGRLHVPRMNSDRSYCGHIRTRHGFVDFHTVKTRYGLSTLAMIYRDYVYERMLVPELSDRAIVGEAARFADWVVHTASKATCSGQKFPHWAEENR